MDFEVNCKVTPESTIPPVYYLFLNLNINKKLYLDQVIFENFKDEPTIHYSKLESIIKDLDEEKKTIIEDKIKQAVQQWEK